MTTPSDAQRRAMTTSVLTIGRLTHLHPDMDANGEAYERDHLVKPQVVPVGAGANVVSSLLTNGRHAPAIDMDLPVLVVPSTTPGHSHVYIDHELSWDNYLRLLAVLVDVGLVQQGFYNSALRRGTTLLRLPHVAKATPAQD